MWYFALGRVGDEESRNLQEYLSLVVQLAPHCYHSTHTSITRAQVKHILEKLHKLLRSRFPTDFNRLKTHQLLAHLPAMLEHITGYRATSEPHERNNKHNRNSALSGNRQYMSMAVGNYAAAAFSATMLLPGEDCKCRPLASKSPDLNPLLLSKDAQYCEGPVGDGLNLLQSWFRSGQLIASTLFPPPTTKPPLRAFGVITGYEARSLATVYQVAGFGSFSPTSMFIDRRYKVPYAGPMAICKGLRYDGVTVGTQSIAKGISALIFIFFVST